MAAVLLPLRVVSAPGAKPYYCLMSCNARDEVSTVAGLLVTATRLRTNCMFATLLELLQRRHSSNQ